jgi:hypothetical protein
MPHDLEKLSCALVEYIRELDNSAFERIKGGAWITESIGTEEFCKRTPGEIFVGLQARLPEEDLVPGPWFDSFVHIAKQWSKLNFYANMAWPGKLVLLVERHGTSNTD